MSADEALATFLRAAEREPDRLLVVTGPTASGKSALALAAAEALGGEIIGADSVQIVRGFDIGSGKPTPEERARVVHHLVDAINPHDDIDASRFSALASAAIVDARARGKRPIVCGGTFLWIRALVFGLADAPSADETIRSAHREIVAREGRQALHAKLAAVDAAAAAKLHPNDVVRVGRALEVFEATGRRMSDLQQDHGFRAERLPARFFGVYHTPDALTRRIEQRVARMLDAGFVDEVRSLTARGFGDARAMGAVGYREVAGFLRGQIAEADLAVSIVRATRVYARRQRTFLKNADVTWL